MVLAGIGSIVFAAGLAVTMSETNFSPIVNGAGRSIISRVAGSVPVMLQTWRKGFQLTMGKRILRFLAISTFVASMVDEMVDRLDMKRLIEIGFPAENGQSAAFFFGLTWIAMSLITLPVMVLINRNRTDFSDRWSAVLVGGLLAGSALGVGMMAGSVLAIALFGWVLRDVVREVSLPVATAWINRQATSDVRATVLSFQGQSVAFGQLAGGLVMGALAQATNLTVAFLVGAVMLAAASLTVGTLTRNTAPSTTSSMT